MKYYKIKNSLSIAVQLDNQSLEVYTSDGYKFLSPKWYTDELLPLLEEISQQEYEEEIYCIVEERLHGNGKDDFEEIDIDSFPFPTLYHGTDAKIIRMTREERQSHKSSCIQVIDYLYPLFKKNYRNDFRIWDCSKLGLEKGLKNALVTALGVIDSYKNGTKIFQYPENTIYLCNYGKARKYAISSFAGGEIGNLAYYLSKVALQTDIPECNPDTIIEAAMKSIVIFGEQNREPVVFPMNNLEFKYLRDERGELLTVLNFDKLPGFRYLKPVMLDLQQAEFI